MTTSANYLERGLLGGQVNFPVCLAPMVGLSHVALRALVRRYTPADARTLWPTEMLSSWRVPREDLSRTPETYRAADESGLVPQILGNEEEPIAQTVRKLVEWGAEGIDINMGCPVSKALRHNYGVALMGDPEYAREVVRMTVRHASAIGAAGVGGVDAVGTPVVADTASRLRRGGGVPVSVKLRAGLQNDIEFLVRFVRGLEEAGAAWITLHPRLGSQKRRGAADWKQIRVVRESVGIPVIGNGDVQCADDVFDLFTVSGCDSVMVGRALAARPWLMWQVGERLGFRAPSAFEGRRAPASGFEEGAEFGQASLFFLSTLQEYFSFAEGFKRFKFYLRMTCGWLEFGHALMSDCSRGQSYEDLEARVTKFFSVPQKMVARTQLRE